MRLAVMTAVLLLTYGFAAASTKQEIQRQYKKWVASSLRLDVDGVLSVLAPDYTLQTFDGKVIPLKMYEVSLRKRKETGQKPANYTTSMESVTATGPEAIVISWETSITDTPDPITNKIQKLIHVHQYRDTWDRFEGTWKLSKTVTLLEKTTIAPDKQSKTSDKH